MKPLFRSLLSSALVPLLSIGLLTALAGAGQSDPIDQFWTKFKTAVQKQDKNSIAAMSQFPIEMPYGVAKVRNRTQLLRRYREIFSQQANAAKCFDEAKPVIDSTNKNRFTVGCKDTAGNEVVIYGFVRTRGVWKFNSLDNLNE